MRGAAPSVFAEGKHASRSERYTYNPTIDVLRGLRKEGFGLLHGRAGQSRVEGKAEFTKHTIRMRHAGHVSTKPEANEIILINSHDGASSYQMLADNVPPPSVAMALSSATCPTIQGEVIEGAFRVLDDFEAVDASTEGLRSTASSARSSG